jgi:DNA modification methylase
MKTLHQLFPGDSRDLGRIEDASIHLVVTSPPYPMIAMWDAAFSSMSAEAKTALHDDNGPAAFAAMHRELDRVWAECFRVLVPGGFACINIGDATRTTGGDFRLFHNHARVLSGAVASGFTVLPDILWRKPTNAPNKFMGSGMLPAGAYVTYEHEYILVLRKGSKRVFSGESRERRARSAFFWEERNAWFSDVWKGLGGARQPMTAGGRSRSGAFPVELPHRLIQMYSLYGERVLDPFAGTGTTAVAAVMSGRSSICTDLDPGLLDEIPARLATAVEQGQITVRKRLKAHRSFVTQRLSEEKTLKHHNLPHDMPVMTRQEVALELVEPLSIRSTGPGQLEAEHAALQSMQPPATASAQTSAARSP